MALDIFRSTRLVYTRLEEHEEWDKMLLELRNSPSFFNGDTGLPQPGSKTSAKEYRETLVKHCSMVWYICLPRAQPSQEQSSDNSEAQRTEVAPGCNGLTAIGMMCLNRSGPTESHSQHGSASVGIELLPGQMGKGYGSEALKWLQWYAFECARLHRLEIQCSTWNKGALRLYQRLNWVVEGTAREAIWFLGGWHGLVTLSILVHEWEALQGKGKQVTSDDVAKMMNSE